MSQFPMLFSSHSPLFKSQLFYIINTVGLIDILKTCVFLGGGGFVVRKKFLYILCIFVFLNKTKKMQLYLYNQITVYGVNENANLDIDLKKFDFNKYLLGIIDFLLFGFISINKSKNSVVKS